ncbi:MAG: peptide chain release factor N(5)-glutamine methyltransferase [Proteobacteria bacterium]|nr:MAG: peptide chain release factor N(5)-glutamine methyltransferase [Pseudomonadota bacterium]
MSGPRAGTSLIAARRAIAARLAAAGIETPDLDARLLVGLVTGLDLTGLTVAAERPLTAAEGARLADLVQRRLDGWPVARLAGAKEFWGLSFTLDAATLVPRPDTETVVEAALHLLHGRRNEPLRIADLGTGTGALLLALLSELPRAYGIGTDISRAALAPARANATRLGLAARAGFVASDYAAALGESFDLIVSNPPYIATAEIATLPREVREHDPHLALDGGPDGLAAYRRLLPQAAGRLRRGGTLVVEVGAGQADAVADLMRAAGFSEVGSRADLGGILRAVGGRKDR